MEWKTDYVDFHERITGLWLAGDGLDVELESGETIHVGYSDLKAMQKLREDLERRTRDKPVEPPQPAS